MSVSRGLFVLFNGEDWLGFVTSSVDFSAELRARQRPFVSKVWNLGRAAGSDLAFAVRIPARLVSFSPFFGEGHDYGLAAHYEFHDMKNLYMIMIFLGGPINASVQSAFFY